MKAAHLKNVLWHESIVEPLDLNDYTADVLKRAARVWTGKAVVRKAEAIQAVRLAINKNGAQVVKGLTAAQQEMLSIIARYGDRVSSCLLSAELTERGQIPDIDTYRFSRNRVDGPLETLTSSLILLRDARCYETGRNASYRLQTSIAKEISPGPPLPWPSGTFPVVPNVTSSGYRSSAEIQLDFWSTYDALKLQGDWNPLKSGSLPKAVLNRVKKLVKLPSALMDPLQLPDPEEFYYELMRGMELAEADEGFAIMNESDAFRDMDPVQLIWHLTHAWTGRRVWQDGIGTVPDRDSEFTPVRIPPNELESSRFLLIWGLQRLAHTDIGWVELESFVAQLYKAAERHGLNFFWTRYTWNPEFDLVANKYNISEEQRNFPRWLSQEGIWAANAVFVTLYSLGLIERGRLETNFYFRLTPLGRLILGAPEIQGNLDSAARRFLIVQPNFDVTVYLREMDGRDLQRVLPFLTKTSTFGGEVQGFRLERERVYQALEEGLTIDDIRSRLSDHAKEAIPATVERALVEWSGKRESLTLRRGVTVIFTDTVSPPAALKPRELSPGCWMAQGTETLLAKAFPKGRGGDHADYFSPEGSVTEEGMMTFADSSPIDSITRARLEMIAAATANPFVWQISAKSIGKAAALGIPAAQSIAWATAMLGNEELPALLSVTIQQWTKAPRRYFGETHVLQITDWPTFSAICHSAAFSELIAGVIEPEWILFHKEQAKTVKKLLENFGFNLTGPLKADPPSSVATPAAELVSFKTTKPSLTKPKKKSKRRVSRRRRW